MSAYLNSEIMFKTKKFEQDLKKSKEAVLEEIRSKLLSNDMKYVNIMTKFGGGNYNDLIDVLYKIPVEHMNPIVLIASISFAIDCGGKVDKDCFEKASYNNIIRQVKYELEVSEINRPDFEIRLRQSILRYYRTFKRAGLLPKITKIDN